MQIITMSTNILPTTVRKQTFSKRHIVENIKTYNTTKNTNLLHTSFELPQAWATSLNGDKIL